MALSFGQTRGDDVVALIAKKNYSKAIEVLRAQLQGQHADPRLRLQLADVLVLAGKGRDAVVHLTALADEFAREGFAAKAISVLKKIQKIDPGQRDVDVKIAALIQEKQRNATVLPPAGFEIGMEEIGFEPPPRESAVAVPEEPLSAPSVGEPRMAPEAEEPPAPSPEPEDVPEIALEPEALEAEPILAEPASLDLVPLEAPAPSAPSSVVDNDLLFADGVEEVEPLTEPEPASPDPMSDSHFAEEVLSLIDSVFPSGEGAAAGPAGEAPATGSQIVVSPLFKDFSVDEMVAVIQGLKLLTFKRGDVILREGEPGESLYMLTSGMVRAFRKDAAGLQVKLGDLNEGVFFGEVSILTGKPRSATIAALTRCELLELDRPTLDSITATHPHVWDVLQEFADRRTPRG
ncbi:MAG TPA: cyclic nucleotide-binding domain-containing protein [Vicinamibacteria bacterium]|nr:cyclic nucleotide-binding domain-containing protein [Vicinamibacteria bacterium]